MSPLRRALVAVASLGAAAAPLASCVSLDGLDHVPAADESGAPDAAAESASPPVDAGHGARDATASCSPDLLQDPPSCGACGHDCSKGRCQQGLCTLSDGSEGLFTIAVRGAHEPTRSVVNAVAASGAQIFWAAVPLGPDGMKVVDTEGVVRTCTMPSCAATVRTIATMQHDPAGIAVDAKSVYWVNSGRHGYVDGIGAMLKAAR